MADYVSKFTGTEIDEAIQKSKDINKNATEINNNLQFVDQTKANLSGIRTGEVVSKKEDGTIQGTGIINEADKIFFPKDGRFPSASIDVGPAITISENGGWAQNHTNTLGKDYIFVDYENTKAGTTKPVYWARTAEEQGVIINQGNTQDMQLTSFEHVPTANSQVNKLMFDFPYGSSDFLLEIISLDTGKPIKYIPSEAAWRNNQGIRIPAGINDVLNGNPMSFLTSYNLRFVFKNPTTLKGDGNKPYIAVDRQLITAKNILVEGDGTGSPDTAEQIRDKLGSLAGDDRLDISTIKNVPGGIDTSNLADKKLSNVLTVDFEKKFLTTDAYQKIAEYMSTSHPAVIEQANELKPSGAVDLANTSGGVIFLDYQFGSNSQTIRQALPPSSQGKYIMFATVYPNPFTGTQIILSPASGETINGSNSDYTITRSGFLGIAVPTAGGYIWVQSTNLSGETGKTIIQKINADNSGLKIDASRVSGGVPGSVDLDGGDASATSWSNNFDGGAA